MSQRQKHRVVLADFKAKKRDEDAIEIEGENGETFRIDPPALWPDDVLTLSAEKKPVEMAIVLLGGQERYEAFVAAGGSAGVLNAIVAEELGLDTGESSASSSS